MHGRADCASMHCLATAAAVKGGRGGAAAIAPTTSAGEMICQAPRSAWRRSAGSTVASTSDTAKAGPPRTTSSENSSIVHSSMPQFSPMPAAIGCTHPRTTSTVPSVQNTLCEPIGRAQVKLGAGRNGNGGCVGGPACDVRSERPPESPFPPYTAPTVRSDRVEACGAAEGGVERAAPGCGQTRTWRGRRRRGADGPRRRWPAAPRRSTASRQTAPTAAAPATP